MTSLTLPTDRDSFREVWRFSQAALPIHARLESTCEAVVRLMGDRDQLLTLDITVRGDCPPAYREPVLRIAHELVGNAVEHGMRGRMVGSIAVALLTDGGRTVLDVRDDGWGCGAYVVRGGGLALARRFARGCGGEVRLQRHGQITSVTITMPHHGAMQ